MALNFGDIATGGSYFKGDDYNHAVALLIEPTNLERQVPTNYGPKDTITADITVFGSEEEIDNDGGQLNEGVKIQQIDLAKKLAHLVGGATVVTVEKLEKSAKLPNGAWVWRTVPADIKGKVIAYAERREAAGEDVLGDLLS